MAVLSEREPPKSRRRACTRDASAANEGASGVYANAIAAASLTTSTRFWLAWRRREGARRARSAWPRRRHRGRRGERAMRAHAMRTVSEPFVGASTPHEHRATAAGPRRPRAAARHSRARGVVRAATAADPPFEYGRDRNKSRPRRRPRRAALQRFRCRTAASGVRNVQRTKAATPDASCAGAVPCVWLPPSLSNDLDLFTSFRAEMFF